MRWRNPKREWGGVNILPLQIEQGQSRIKALEVELGLTKERVEGAEKRVKDVEVKVEKEAMEAKLKEMKDKLSSLKNKNENLLKSEVDLKT